MLITYMQLSVWRLYSGAFNFTVFDESLLTTFCLSTLLAYLDRRAGQSSNTLPTYILLSVSSPWLYSHSCIDPTRGNCQNLAERGFNSFTRRVSALNDLVLPCRLAGFQVFIQR